MNGWQRQLDALAGQGMLRSLRTVDGIQGPRVTLDGRNVLLLCSNNYLGLASHPTLIETATKATRDFGVGTGGSRLVSGSMRPHTELEERLAEFKATEAALLFNSGYAANTGILQGLFGPEDTIFSDELNHASIIDGCRLSQAKTLVFPHRDLAALSELMTDEAGRRRGRWLIVTDGVFSMDGDMADLPGLCRLKEQHDALLMVDDAHGSGVLGKQGRGTAELLDCLDQVDFHMGTLGKAFGCSGAYLAASRPVIDMLINSSRSYIFSTSLPPAVPATACAALEVVCSPEGRQLRMALEINRQVFADRLQQSGLSLLGTCTQIIPVLTRDPQPTMAVTSRLMQEGVFLQGIRPPTVAVGRCRLRATVMATHRPEELELAADLILDALGELG